MTDDKKLKPVFIDTRYLRPLPQEMWGMACANCNKVTARWELHEPTVFNEEGTVASEEFLPMCSSCFLYESNWGVDRRPQIDVLVEETETEIKERFIRDVGGRMMSDKDCDRILAAVALTSRLIEVRAATTQFRQQVDGVDEEFAPPRTDDEEFAPPRN